jgi:cell division septal protein FtsQ
MEKVPFIYPLVYKNKEIEDIPFVEAIEVSILSPDTIRIQVYEKALAGYVTYLGKHMYFDKDGIVVENSDIATPGIPEVSGLEFDYIILHEPLPVEDKKIFKDILSVTQMLQKYEVSCDKLSFDSQKQMTLYIGDVKVSLGSTLNLNEKIMELPYLIPSLAGKKGTLRMENFTQENDYITFDVEN